MVPTRDGLFLTGSEDEVGLAMLARRLPGCREGRKRQGRARSVRSHRRGVAFLSSCARRSDDSDARSALARLEEPEALFAGCGCK